MARNCGARRRIFARALAVLIAVGIASSPGVPALAQGGSGAQTFPPEEIEQLAAPIALYPDSLLAQVLMASTYPLEVVEAQRWAKANATLQGEALDAALRDQTWDDSVKSLTSFPQVLDMMSEKLDWTQKLGDAFLAQQSDVMDAIQRLRGKAQAQGALETTEQQRVIVEQAPATTIVEGAPSTIIRIEPSNPQVVYVPTYNPSVVYGTWAYPSYPPYYYRPPGYVAATSLLSFGIGMAVGSSLWGGCNWGWGRGDIDIDIDRYNSFNRNVSNDFNRTNINNRFQNGKWQHDSAHRRGVGYRDANTQQRFGKQPRGDVASREAFRGRAEQGRRDLARDGGAGARRDLTKAGGVDRSAAAKNLGDRAGAKPDLGNRPGGGKPDLGNRAGGAGKTQLANRAGGKPDLASRNGGGGAREKASSRAGAARSAGKNPQAFQRSGSAQQVRRDASRGSASRQSAAAHRGGGGGGGRAKAAGGGGGGGRAKAAGGGKRHR